MPYLFSAAPNLPIEALQALLLPILMAQGVGLVELQFRRERSGWVLRVMIENPEGPLPGAGITLDRCADVSHALSEALDQAESNFPAYTLEVTSPGIERPLYEAAEYLRFHGQKAKVVLKKSLDLGPLKGQAALEGWLQGLTEGGDPQIKVPLRGGVHLQTIPLGEIKVAHLVYDSAGSRKGEPKKTPKQPGNRRQGHGKNSE